MHTADLEHALGQGPGLIKDDTFDLGEGLQIIRPLDQHARVAGAADPGEEAQGDADDQRARAGDDEERQRPVDPIAPGGDHPRKQPDQGRQNRQRQRAVADGGRIDLCKLGDKILRS